MSVREDAGAPMAEYLATPDRVVELCFPRGRGRRVDARERPEDARYEVRLMPQEFLFLNIEPVVRVRAVSGQELPNVRTTLTMSAEEFRIDGLPPELRSLNDDIDFAFVGTLSAIAPANGGGSCTLDGTAELRINADVPPMLQMVPGMAIAAEQALDAVLERLQSQLVREVAGDYARFAATSAARVPVESRASSQ